MKYDRVRIKTTARSILNRAQPRPWLVTLVDWFLNLDLSALCLLFFLSAGAFPGSLGLSPVLIIPAVLFSGAVFLFLLMLHAGYRSYELRLWQTGKGGLMDLLTAFFRGSEVFFLYDFLVTACLGWALLAVLMAWGLRFLLGLVLPQAVMEAASCLARTAALAFFIDRCLQYALSFHILMGQSRLSARDAIAKSKRLMAGRKLDYLLLILSFLGWAALTCGIVVLTLLPGVLIQMAQLPLFAGGLPEWFLLPFLGAGLIAASPMALWLRTYLGVSTAGFYAAASAPPFPGASPSGGGKRLKQ